MGYRVKEIRQEKNITQKELEKRSGLSRQTISAIENGRVKFVSSNTLLALAKALECDIDEIFFPSAV